MGHDLTQELFTITEIRWQRCLRELYHHNSPYQNFTIKLGEIYDKIVSREIKRTSYRKREIFIVTREVHIVNFLKWCGHFAVGHHKYPYVVPENT